MSSIREIPGLSAIAGAFDAFLVDQYGVLRDGRGPYPGAAETLVRLKQAGKRVIVLSNSGKRSTENDRRLAELGFERGSWDWFLTSGEVAWRLLKRESEGENGAARKCLLISRDGDLSPLNGLNFVRTESGDEADTVLLAGSEGDVHPLSYYEDLLGPAARRGVPCLCTNPDKVMLTRSGPAFGAGRIAELYEEMGGHVRWIGKPFADIYDFALDFLGCPEPGRVCAIGDSVEHDIGGAASAGLASVLVATGILEHRSDEERRQLFREHGASPDFILSKFLW
ncbi:TIGR01459 family HAD-type hydrolase [Sinorhizobium medicae]|uniref:HAD-superfamily subfamily IIA hydrolase like protein n=2 Tax=Sinorhizobium medicae TaxID=110321 RepID=A6UBF6_SINMW|nr:TIGR01459 family HAD-type hydrolase [Sinorhizobium medicae]ABR60986.1 HAD-superfamily subfamily IIA hydrolase like protein [Sinorhizobium medicae WSM419]MBO1964773.1 TIGR01459 family HAD-type hydrolase [Sinorhizobium medicae]MDX0405446.1 TIGR01459 family HAD-type hydrolase [Sinorhizobium medicae]MDX0410994.1 TIGR01459 family HAD-type hydrolase [Sinorhizobium medicae]MDX0417420.1 TIGR01459 family HAD-type hydrolase [Sinorhizobium medicae]